MFYSLPFFSLFYDENQLHKTSETDRSAIVSVYQNLFRFSIDFYSVAAAVAGGDSGGDGGCCSVAPFTYTHIYTSIFACHSAVCTSRQCPNLTFQAIPSSFENSNF